MTDHPVSFPAQASRLDRGFFGNAEPLVDSFPYPARQAGCFMMVSNSMGVNFPSLR
ncbi:hypothetical protein FHX68_1352 [Microbacterium lacticum]|uniref:Uncharacterized protein n=1 Tax=Microbacterium lacticum TaxID=33885 RepID=A0A543KUA2_9MICO|nr:hypothetical protein FHX68_1352 [Microbacterium lacticum]